MRISFWNPVVMRIFFIPLPQPLPMVIIGFLAHSHLFHLFGMAHDAY